MSTYETWSLIIAALGFLAVVVSLHLLIRTLKAALIDSLSNRQYEIDKLFIDRPELRKYFYDGVDLPPRDSIEYARVISVAEYLLDFFVIVLIQKDEYTELLPRDWWLKYMKDLFSSSPALCEVLDQRKEWYRKEVLHSLRREALETRRTADQESVASR